MFRGMVLSVGVACVGYGGFMVGRWPEMLDVYSGGFFVMFVGACFIAGTALSGEF